MRNTPQHFRGLIDALEIPKRDTVGLRVTNRAPAGFNTVDGYFVCNGKKYDRDEYAGHRTVGLYVKCDGYFTRKGNVHVVKSAGIGALVHEIGHHVTLTLNDQGGIEGTLEILLGYFGREQFLYGTFGLRQYSLTNWKELLADCYKVRYCGTMKQWKNLVRVFGTYGLNLAKMTAAQR